MLKVFAGVVYLLGVAIVITGAMSLTGGRARVTAPDWMTYSPLKHY
jgi:hypothetical protein